MPNIKVHIFHNGFVYVDKAVPLHENNPLAATGFMRSKKKRMKLPVSSYLIEHPKGKILIDTGWDTKYSDEKIKRFFGMVQKASTPIIKKDEGIDTKLKNLGLTDSDIDAVYYSHLDLDHTNGTALVKNAKHFYAAKEEIEGAKKNTIRFNKKDWSMVNLEAFEFQETGIGPVGRSLDIFGDNSVILVHTPGHSAGHTSVLVKGSEKYLIIGGDAAYIPESFEKRVIPGYLVNKEKAYKSLDYLIECKNDPNCIGVFVNHDPTVKEQIIEIK